MSFVRKCGKIMRGRQGTDDNIRRVRFARRIRKEHGIFNSCCLSAATVVTRTRLKLYVRCLSCKSLEHSTDFSEN